MVVVVFGFGFGFYYQKVIKLCLLSLLRNYSWYVIQNKIMLQKLCNLDSISGVIGFPLVPCVIIHAYVNWLFNLI